MKTCIKDMRNVKYELTGLWSKQSESQVKYESRAPKESLHTNLTLDWKVWLKHSRMTILICLIHTSLDQIEQNTMNHLTYVSCIV